MSEFIKQKQVEGLVSSLASKALDSAVLKIANNLSDVSASSARTNLDVYSKTEVQSLVAGAEDAYSVASLTERAALTGLKVADRVFVTNDGDSKWALYIVTAITDGKGSTSTFTKVADEDLFTNALSKEAVKNAYESNANTNAFTDAEKTKVGHITVSQAVNLDTIESELTSTTSTATSALSTANSATSAASTAQTTANTAVSDAANAQSSANTAQSTADSALSTANTRELAFTETVQDFTNQVGEAAIPFSLELDHAIAEGFTPAVFINGLRVKTISFTAGSSSLTLTAPYIIEATDTLTVQYAHR